MTDVTFAQLAFSAPMGAVVAFMVWKRAQPEFEAPYMPIEVSRLAAHDATAGVFATCTVFAIVAAVAGATLVDRYAFHVLQGVAFAGLAVLAVYRDDEHYWAHMGGAAAMAAGAFLFANATPCASVAARAAANVGFAVFSARSGMRTSWCWLRHRMPPSESAALMFTGDFSARSTRCVFQASALAQYASVTLLAYAFTARSECGLCCIE